MKHLISKKALFYFFTFLLFYRPPPLILPSRSAGVKITEYGKDFQTADEHHERTEPLGQVGQFAPRHGGSDLSPKVGPTFPTQLSVMVMELVLSIPIAIIVNEMMTQMMR